MSTTEQSILANVSVPTLASLDDNDLGFGSAVGQSSLVGILSRVAYGGEPISWPSPCGVNCSYTFSFVGPAYQCVDLGPWSPYLINITLLSLLTPQANPPPSNVSISYLGIDDWGVQTNTPISRWIFYNSFNNTIRCVLYNATYTTNVSYANNIQSVQNNLEPIHSVNLLSQSQFDDLSTSPTINLTIARSQNVNLFSLHETLDSVLGGWVGKGVFRSGVDFSEETQVNTGIVTWSGVASWSSDVLTLPNELSSKIQDLMTNYTISLIYLRNYPYEPSVMTEFNISSQPIIQTSVPATITSYPVVYVYSSVALWQIYSTALGFTLIAVMLGSFMLYTTGVAGELSFSQILVTTRNPTLDKISEGAGRGGKYITDRVQKVKVRYGRLDSTEFGFGTDDEIHSLNAEL